MVLKTKVSPARDWRGAQNVRDKPDSLYHNVLYNKPQRKIVMREPSPVYSRQSTPEKHFIEPKEYSPVEIPTNYPEAETVNIDRNSYEIQQEINTFETVAEVEPLEMETPVI